MKKVSIIILMVVLFGLAGNSTAVSPTPVEELKLGHTENVCTIHVVYSSDRERGILMEEAFSTLTFETSMSKKDILEKITKHLSNKLNDVNVSEFKVECKFPK